VIAWSSAVRHRHLGTAIGLVLVGLMTLGWAGDFTPQEQRGKRLYHEGVVADGTSVTAAVGALRLPGTRFPCASCHGPDGLGRPDAGVVPSDITWANLTKPYGLRHDNGRSHPPYTADTIVRAVTAGVDPAGNSLDPAMPRYTLDSTAIQDLVAYLKRLGSDSDQGVGSNEIAVAAVLPRDGPLAEIGTVVGRLLSAYFDRVNQKGGIYNRQIVLKTATFDSSGSAVDTLRRLMTETQVFAVVAPLVLGHDVALVEFTEGAALPVIGPLTPSRRSRSAGQGFTFYLMAGLEDQARALVKYAQNDLAPADPKVAILPSDDGAGLHIEDAIRQQSRNAEWTPVLSLHLTGSLAVGDAVSQLSLAAVNIIFYDGGPTHLVALAEEAARSGWRPAILTTGLAVTRESFTRLRETGARVFVAYPVLGSDQSPDALQRLHSLQAAYGIPAQHLPMQVAALASARILIEGLQRGGRDLTRAKFVAALAALQNFETGLVPPISFGANRRIGVGGVHVVPLGRTQGEHEHVWISLD
jgi:ABC-type branched-subunit amino acid transport system substrate-binding protein